MAVIRRLLLAFIIFTFFSCQGTDDFNENDKKVKGVSDSEIVIGSSLAMGGHASYLGTQIKNGAISYIQKINNTGGIFGRKIKLITLDDKYDPPLCLINTQDLIIKQKAFSLFCYVGTPTTEKILPMIEEAGIPLVGIFTGAHILRDPKYKSIINVRASYYQETAAAVKYFIETRKTERFAVFYQYDAYGFDGLRGTETALREYNKVPVATGKYIRGTLDIEKGLKKIIKSKAQAVFLIGTYGPCAKFIIESKKRGYKGLFYNVSFVGAKALLEKTGKYGEGVIVSQVVPPPDFAVDSPALWGIKQYKIDLKKSFPNESPNYVSLEGYINARVLVEGLKRAGKDLTRQKFIQAIESIKNFDLGIQSNLTFSENDHQGLDRVYFTEIKNGKLVLIK